MNRKDFSSIKILVVVAIIGILAAIGVVTFGGFQGAAKANTVKTNHKTVVNFIKASIAKCTMGEELKLKRWDTWGTFYDTSDLCKVSNSENHY